jgi:hypothetical protein
MTEIEFGDRKAKIVFVADGVGFNFERTACAVRGLEARRYSGSVFRIAQRADDDIAICEILDAPPLVMEM